MTRGDRIAAAAIAGVASPLVAATATYLYLRAITLDDGLETLVFFPILGLAVALASGLSTWGLDGYWRTVAGLVVTTGATAATAILVLLLNLSADAQPPSPLVVLSVSTFASGFAIVGCLIGCGTTALASRARARSRT